MLLGWVPFFALSIRYVLVCYIHVFSCTGVHYILLYYRHIEDSLGSVATQINFFIHNLAQHKFSSPQGPPTLLTFVPQVCIFIVQMHHITSARKSLCYMYLLPIHVKLILQAYSIETDGKIQSAVIVAYYKRYYPDTYTVSNYIHVHVHRVTCVVFIGLLK